MKKTLFSFLLLLLLGSMNSVCHAAELLDVKPVIAGDAVSIEITADIAMTYTYYKLPGQARAVVDIAEADPEKVEPLIVVNKGVVSSISVDKAQISGIVVSRIIFNLVSESEITVTAAPDRKLLTVTFGGSPAATEKTEAKPEAVPVPKPVVKSEPQAIAVPTPPITASSENSTGLVEPADKTAIPLAKEVSAAAATTAAAAASRTLLPAVSPVPRVPKLEPVVPVTPTRPSVLSIKGITTGASFIEIRTNRPVTDYVATRISGPERLVIDIAGEKINQKAKSVAIRKFGISKARIGVSPKNIRVVIDSEKSRFPDHTIAIIDEGLRINFK